MYSTISRRLQSKLHVWKPCHGQCGRCLQADWIPVSYKELALRCSCCVKLQIVSLAWTSCTKFWRLLNETLVPSLINNWLTSAQDVYKCLHNSNIPGGCTAREWGHCIVASVLAHHCMYVQGIVVAYSCVTLLDRVIIWCELDEMKAIVGCCIIPVHFLSVTVIRVPPACGPNSGHTSLSTGPAHVHQHSIQPCKTMCISQWSIDPLTSR